MKRGLPILSLWRKISFHFVESRRTLKGGCSATNKTGLVDSELDIGMNISPLFFILWNLDSFLLLGFVLFMFLCECSCGFLMFLLVSRILAPTTYIFFASAIPVISFGEQLERSTGKNNLESPANFILDLFLNL